MPDENEIPYPSQYKSRVILKDGSTCLFRPIKKDDVSGWLEFFNSLSETTKFFRFHSIPHKMTEEDALRFCTVDYYNNFAFVAEAMEKSKKKITAIGRYSRLPSASRTAEIAFVTDDRYQVHGIGTKLIEWLATVARKNDIDTFEASVLADNTTMMTVFQDYGFHMKKVLQNNVYHITFPLTKTPEVIKKKDERTLHATLNSLEHILKPKAVAVIGASNKPGAIGQLVFQSMLQNKFSGVVYPVTPNSNSVMAVKAYPSILDVPGEVDLAIIAVPASLAIKVTDECGRKKVKGIIVISDGFKESGTEGAEREVELREIAFGYGMRIIGPNCMGLINTDPEINLNATFALIYPLRGNIAFISQSGALGLGILQYAKNRGIGFSSYISVGNRADIASTDMLQYWEKDPDTKVILLYMESFDNPEIFSRVSKRISAKKPILSIKGGNTEAGSRATRSHTGAMTTTSAVSEALFRQAGIVRVNTIEEMFHSAMLLSTQPVPKGKRVAIITNGGGPGILAADSCSQNQLTLPEFSEETVRRLKAVIKRDININNPLDLTAAVSTEEFEKSLKILAEDKDNDSIITIYIPPAGLNIKSIEDAIHRVAPLIRQNGKPVLSCFVGQTDSVERVSDIIPYYLFPEDAALALSNAVRYGNIARQERGTIPEFKDINRNRAKEIIKSVLTSSSERPLWVPAGFISELFSCYGIKMTETKTADTAEKAAQIAAGLGFPVVIKLNSSVITHKSDVGGVILDINSETDVKNAFNKIRERLAKIGREKEMEGVTMQHMISDGVEVIVGVAEDPSLGHAIMFGLGGIYAELMNDTALKLQPLTDLDARDLINSVKMSKLLKGYRGSAPMDTDSLEELLLRLSALIEDIPEITEMDMNPVKVKPNGQGYCIVDARIMIK